MAYSEELAKAICDKVAEGKSLRKACRELDAVAPTFLLWCSERPLLAEQYARARGTGADIGFEELADLQEEEPVKDATGKIDSGWVAWKRLQIDTKKWELSKKAPKKYGEKLELSGDPKSPLQTVQRIELTPLVNDKA